MALQISISNAIGARAVAGGGGIDPDAQAFITAASITDPTQKSAINQLVVDLKGYGVWTKMKALYPMVGGTSTSHSYNLRNTSQFQITWSGGLTHNSQGVTGGGVNGYGNTGLIPSTSLTNNSLNVTVYSRTSTQNGATEMGCSTSGFLPIIGLTTRGANGILFDGYDFSAHRLQVANSDGRGFYHGNILTSTDQKIYKNGVQVATNSVAQIQTQPSVRPLFILARNDSGTPANYSDKNLAFASIGDGLTNTEAANFYTAVQTFQVTLGRSIGTQTVSDADAQAFVTNAGIVDQVEANAINNLVIGLKADGLWTKMKAVYPFVGGSSSTMKYNLKNPLDTDAAFRLVFNGGWTFSSTGATPNGTNAYADTKLATTGNIAQNSGSMGVYSRTNTATTGAHGIRPSSLVGLFELFERWTDNNFYCYLNDSGGFFGTSILDSRGFNQGSRTALNAIRYNRNTNTNTGITASNGTSTLTAYIGASNANNTATFYNNREIAFFYIGDGLSNTEMQNYYTRVNTFQTALNRNV